jgi:peptidoglycan/LPS O-acetylase OafA/YrhL
VLLTVIVIGAFLQVKEISASDFAITPLVGVLVLLVAASEGGPVHRALHLKPLVWLGRVSYSIYMVHALVHTIYNVALTRLLRSMPQLDRGATVFYNETHLNPNPILGTVWLCATIATVCLVSHLTYTYIEDPFRNRSKQLANRWFGARPARSTADRAAVVSSGD